MDGVGNQAKRILESKQPCHEQGQGNQTRTRHYTWMVVWLMDGDVPGY